MQAGQTAESYESLSLYGGTDGLNTVIPYGDEVSAKTRPPLAYPVDQVLKLDDDFGLNPGLAGLHKLYGAKKMAVVRCVGYPKPDHSHFRSMDIWQTAGRGRKRRRDRARRHGEAAEARPARSAERLRRRGGQ
ncbi:DUF1501 domain-containing protein [Actinoplanes sp. TFC3]|uniref:DUF1501 domain-containing protein n=1 Tax=Actinoplanes sp. TFC3 TaxID=1710355 RepID=UPI00082C350E|nr:hypothetical protein [Actinoplanes sp. TFC3]